jgi:hypothetical protein
MAKIFVKVLIISNIVAMIFLVANFEIPMLKCSAIIKTKENDRKVILVKRDNKLRKPLITHFGGI